MENQRVRLTKRLLKEGLIAIMAEMPFERITVKRLCEEAGINRTTFYLHYTDTEQVLIDAENDIINTALQRVTNPDPKKSPTDNILSFLTYVQTHMIHFKVLLSFEGSAEFVKRLSREVIQDIKQINPAIITDDRTEMLYHFALIASVSLIHEWLDSGFRLLPLEMAELINRMTKSVVEN